jgi:hypothetical protein
MKKTPSTLLEARDNGSGLNGDSIDLKQLHGALTAFKRGDFSARLPMIGRA